MKQPYADVLCLQLRRGADQADIFSMAFSANSQLLVLSGSKGTVHIFRIKANEMEEPIRRTEAETTLVSSRLSSDSPLFKAGSLLLSSAAATAGSSFSFVKGLIPSLPYLCTSACSISLSCVIWNIFYNHNPL